MSVCCYHTTTMTIEYCVNDTFLHRPPVKAPNDDSSTPLHRKHVRLVQHDPAATITEEMRHTDYTSQRD